MASSYKNYVESASKERRGPNSRPKLLQLNLSSSAASLCYQNVPKIGFVETTTLHQQPTGTFSRDKHRSKSNLHAGHQTLAEFCRNQPSPARPFQPSNSVLSLVPETCFNSTEKYGGGNEGELERSYVSRMRKSLLGGSTQNKKQSKFQEFLSREKAGREASMDDPATEAMGSRLSPRQMKRIREGLRCAKSAVKAKAAYSKPRVPPGPGERREKKVVRLVPERNLQLGQTQKPYFSTHASESKASTLTAAVSSGTGVYSELSALSTKYIGKRTAGNGRTSAMAESEGKRAHNRRNRTELCNTSVDAGSSIQLAADSPGAGGRNEMARQMKETLAGIRGQPKLVRATLRSFLAEIIGKETGAFAEILQCVKAEFDASCEETRNADKTVESLRHELASERDKNARIETRLRECEKQSLDAESQKSTIKTLEKEASELRMRLFDAKNKLVEAVETGMTNKIADELEALYKENRRLRHRLKATQGDLGRSRIRESALVGLLQAPPRSSAKDFSTIRGEERNRSVEVGMRRVRIPVLDFTRVRRSVSSEEGEEEEEEGGQGSIVASGERVVEQAVYYSERILKH